MSRVTGKDAASVSRYYATFKAICSLAKFETPQAATAESQEPVKAKESDTKSGSISHAPTSANNQTGFHYNIQIHLPATTDISVYNAIFKSLKDNLII